MKELNQIKVQSSNNYSPEDALREYLQDHMSGCSEHSDDWHYYNKALDQLELFEGGEELMLEINDIVESGGLVENENNCFVLASLATP